MENSAPITFELEKSVTSGADLIAIMDSAYLALFHNSEDVRNRATKRILSLFSNDGFEVTNIYASFHDVFIRANYDGEPVVFYVGCKPKSYHERPTVNRFLEFASK